ncbi:hypothetical protein [Parapedobacter sp. DT-150]|uniref:hypothetical protein n=1 Tax=Parapedobacter sp. DT-150 TaxID=3396162 RepID=UPI003F1C60C4
MEWADPEKDQKIADRLQKGIQNRLASENRNLQRANNAVAKLESKIAKNGSTEKLETKLQNAKDKVTASNEIIGDLNNSSSELTLMGSKEVSQKFTFNELAEGSSLGFAYTKDGIITMDIVSDANAIHEAVHGYQIYKSGGIKQSERLDVEVPAYQRQFSFDARSVTGLSSDWGGVRGRSDISKNWVMGLRDGNGTYPYMPAFDRKSMRALIEKIKEQ